MNETLISGEQTRVLKEALRRLEEENSNLREEFSTKIHQLHTLNDVARALNSVLNLDVLFRLIISLATHELGADRGSLMILEGDGLRVKAAFGLSEKVKQKTVVKVGEGVCGTVAASGRPLLVRDREDLLELELKGQGSYRDYSFVCAPIMIDRKSTGVINITSKKSGEPFDMEDLNFLETLANHAAIAIRNASLHQHAQLMAVTDGLTGLFNHRFFHERLVEEIDRCNRYGKSGLCVLMIDIDDFKHLNDKYGHLAGDHVLKEVSSIIRRESRVSDIVSRYGGEEFAVILPETGKRMSLIFAERLRVLVESKSFAMEDMKIEEKVTLSIGISYFPEDASSPSQLIDRADKALYEAKASGKNQVHI